MTTMVRLDEIRARVKARQVFSLQDLLLLVECSKGPVKVGDLTATIGAPKPSITRGIQAMERQGTPFLTREDDQDDRRSPWIKITPAGKRFLAKLLVEVP